MYQHSASASAEDTKTDRAVQTTPSEELLIRMIKRHGNPDGSGFAQVLRAALGHDQVRMREFLALDRQYPETLEDDPAVYYSTLVERVLSDSKLAHCSQRVRAGGGSMRDARRLARSTFEHFLEHADRSSLRLFIFLLERGRRDGFTDCRLSDWAEEFKVSERENRRRLLNAPRCELSSRLVERHGNKGRRLLRIILAKVTNGLELARFLLLDNANSDIAEEAQGAAAHYERLLARCREMHWVGAVPACSDIVH